MHPIWSPHAKLRWQERFPNEDLNNFYSLSRRANKKNKSAIRKKCPVSAKQYMISKHKFSGRYCKIYSDNKQHGVRIIFVVQCNGVNVPEEIITVFSLRLGKMSSQKIIDQHNNLVNYHESRLEECEKAVNRLKPDAKTYEGSLYRKIKEKRDFHKESLFYLNLVYKAHIVDVIKYRDDCKKLAENDL